MGIFPRKNLAGQGIVRAVHGRQYWKISPNGKVRKSYEGERARFPIGYQRFSKGCRAAYFLLPVNELLDIIELNPVKSKWTAGTYLLESYSNRSLTKDWMGEFSQCWIPEFAFHNYSIFVKACNEIPFETFYWKIFKISWDIGIFWNSCSKNWCILSDSLTRRN